MNLAYKKINSSNVSKYIANKSFTVDPSIETQGVTIYIGENSPINKRNYFDANNDNKTSNDEYRRLVYNNIRHLFYKKYDNADQIFISSSRFDNFEESTLYSGSYQTTLRRLGQTTGSSFAGIQGSLYDVNGSLYDTDDLYDFNPWSLGYGDLVTVVSLDTKLYGSRLTPNSVLITIEDYEINEGSGSVATDLYIRDDGEGNLFDFRDEATYNTYLETGVTPDLYIGNVLYSAGFIIITNQDYICIFGSPPTAVNDYYTYLNTQQPEDFDLMQNDFNDCGIIDTSSIALVPLEGESFPDAFIDGNYYLRITQNQKAFIPGVYKIGYTIDNLNGLTSNTGIVTVTITSGPLQITNLSVDVNCDTTSSTNFSFNIEGGIPVYAWSLDGTNYTQLSGFYNIGVVSSSYFPENTGTIYVRDYLENVITQSFITRYTEPSYTVTTYSSSNCNSNNGSIIVESNEDFVYTISGSMTELEPNITYSLAAGNYDILINVADTCTFSQSVTVGQSTPISITSSIAHVTCYGGSNGAINITDINGGASPYTTKIIYPDAREFTTQNVNFLKTGSYDIEVTDDRGCTFTSSINITSSAAVVVSSSISYDNECYPTVNVSSTGGSGSYTYYITTDNNVYITTDTSIDLVYESQEAFDMTIYSIDSNGCSSTVITQSVEGREYIYSGSYCEQT